MMDAKARQDCIKEIDLLKVKINTCKACEMKEERDSYMYQGEGEREKGREKGRSKW